MDYTIKCGIIIDQYPESFYSLSGEYTGFILELWKFIKLQLKKKNKNYKFSEIIIDIKNKNHDWEKLVNLIEEKKLDILVSGIWIKHFSKKNILFSYPIYLKQLKLIYNKRENTEINYIELFKKLLDSWKKPFIFFIFLGSLFGIILILFFPIGKENSKIRIFYNAIVSVFGQTNGLIFDYRTDNKKFVYFSRILILCIVLLINLYFYSLSTSTSLDFMENSNVLEYTLKDKRILVRGPRSAQIVKKNGGIPVMSNNNLLSDYLNKNEKKISGFIPGNQFVDPIYYGDDDLKVSTLYLENEPCAFPINKSKVFLKDDIDSILIDLREDGRMNKICNQYFYYPGKESSTIC